MPYDGNWSVEPRTRPFSCHGLVRSLLDHPPRLHAPPSPATTLVLHGRPRNLLFLSRALSLSPVTHKPTYNVGKTATRASNLGPAPSRAAAWHPGRV